MNETLNIQNGVSPITIDTKVTEGSTRPVMGGGIYEAIQGAQANNKFIVNLTPTAADFSGTMDKTVGEIIEAWEQGKDIWGLINIPTGGTMARITVVSTSSDPSTIPSFNAIVINQALSMLIYVYTGVGGPLSDNSYYTLLYTLTPAT